MSVSDEPLEVENLNPSVESLLSTLPDSKSPEWKAGCHIKSIPLTHFHLKVLTFSSAPAEEIRLKKFLKLFQCIVFQLVSLLF